MSFYKKHWKVFLSMTLSFVTVFFIIPFFMTPGRLTRTVGNIYNSIKSLSFINISKLFTLQFSDDNNLAQVNQQRGTGMNGINNGSAPVYVPSIKPINQTPTAVQPNQPTPRVTRLPIKKTPTPTTVYVKPTKPPKPSPTPLAPPEYLRPGTGLEDIFKKAGELSCVPPALLKAFVAQEAPGVLNWSDDQALFYNAYDWWHRVKEVKQVCAGYGFYTHTGLVAEDSLFAGEKCKDPFSAETANDTYSKVLGSCQMLQSYWEKDYKEPTRQKLKVSKVDRRVLIDCLVGYGIHFRNDTGYSGSCSGDWEMKYVAKAACVNAGGTCDYYNYCYTICNNYNKYAQKNYNCNGATGLFIPGSYCQFK